MSFNCPGYIKEFTEMVQTIQVKTALEIGYGSGELVEALRVAGIKAEGIDKSADLLRVKPAPYMKNIPLEDFTVPAPKGKRDPKYDLVYSSGVLEHFGGQENMIEALKKMASLSKKYILTVVPNKNCAAYMAAKAKTKAEWKDEAAFDGDELRAIHEAAGLKVINTGPIGKEWAKRFGPHESEPYLVFCLAEVIKVDKEEKNKQEY